MDRITKRIAGIVSAGFLTLFIAFAIRYSYGLILPYMVSELAISKTEAGVIFSSYFVTATILSPLMGMLADRFDARIILTLFVAILGAGSCLMSLSSSVAQASIFFAIIGIGHSACWAPVVAVVMRWVSPRRRGIAVSMVDLGTTAGIGVWSIAVPMIVGAQGWRFVWLSLGMTAFVAAAMNFLFIRSRPEIRPHAGDPETAHRPQTSAGKSYHAVLRDRRFYLIGFSYLFISFSILIPFTFLVSYATLKLAIPFASAAGLLLVIAVSGSAGKLILAYVSDRMGRIEIMMLCGLLAALGPLGMAYSRELSTLSMFSAIFGVGYGTIWAVYAASARDFFPGEYSGSIVGLWTLFHGVGSAIAPVLSGWTIDATGTYYWAFILAAAGSLLSLLLLLPLQRVREER
ncbi:MAG TPA: MFS transporter [Syntrophorhabdales bacterium]|nr:MFS transporter [Syntrophorhabdales bacterium]